MDNDSYTPTDDEAETIERAGLAAAWNELQPLKNDELPTAQKVLACLRAFKAASSAEQVARKALKQKHPEAKHINHYPETTDMVCSALAGLDLDGPDEVHPSSIIGARISTLFKAASALEAMSVVYSAFDDCDGIFGTYLAEETTMFVEATIGRHTDAV